MLDVDMDWLIRLAREAGDLALSYSGRVKADLKPDNSLVTQADLAVEAFIRERLEAARPGEAILGEEGGGPPPDTEVVWAPETMETLNW